MIFDTLRFVVISKGKDEVHYNLKVSLKNLFVKNLMHLNCLASHELHDTLQGVPHSLLSTAVHLLCSHSGFRVGREGGIFVSSKMFSAPELKPV